MPDTCTEDVRPECRVELREIHDELLMIRKAVIGNGDKGLVQVVEGHSMALKIIGGAVALIVPILLATILAMACTGCDLIQSNISDGPPTTQPTDTPTGAASDVVGDIAATLDEYGPGILELLGAAGLPCVGLGAVIWRKRKIASDLVDTVQNGLDALGDVMAHKPDGKLVNARKLMTAELKKQAPRTAKFVEKAKLKAKAKRKP